MNLQSTLGTLTQMLQNHCTHKSAIQVRVEYMEMVELMDYFQEGMFILLRERNVQFGADGSNEEGGIEDSLISAELELEDMVNM